MSEKIRVNYAALEDMAKQCQMVAERLTQTAATAQKIQGQMQNGAMIGDAGNIYCEALNTFFQRVTKLSAKFMEEANDIRGAIADMQQADSNAANNFN